MVASQYRINKALDGKGDSVEIQLDIPSICIESFSPNQAALWRLNLDVRRMIIDDHINTSHHAKILTFTRQTKRHAKYPSVIVATIEQTIKLSYKIKVQLLYYLRKHH